MDLMVDKTAAMYGTQIQTNMVKMRVNIIRPPTH
jgi:hypothetical protein